MTVDEAHGLITRARVTGRTANAYLIVGALRGYAQELAELVLADLFGGLDAARVHPDLHWLRPEKKSRIISVDAMRERMLAPMENTSFAGGWRVGVIEGVDRLKEEAANAFLKTLEEPPAQTLFLLLTDAPEQLLPTIVSRCQRIDLPDAGAKRLGEPWFTQVMGVLVAPVDGTALYARVAMAGRLEGVLDKMLERTREMVAAENEVDEEDPGEEIDRHGLDALVSAGYRRLRSEMMATLLGWFRDLAAIRLGGEDAPLVNEEYRPLLVRRAALLTPAQCFRNIELVEEAESLFERSLSEAQVLAYLFDRLVTGSEAKGR